jgi:hypothetical protein
VLSEVSDHEGLSNSAAAIAATAEMALSGGVSTADEARAYARLVARGTTMHAALAALTTGPSGRAALYAEALRDLAVLDERVGRDRRMQRETPTDVGEALVEARARVRQLQPHTVLWAAHVTVGGTPNVVCVQTRDKSDFVDDISMRTWVVGASAEISWGDPLAFSVACREVSTCHYEPMWRDRESDHVDAVDRLCDANGWLLVRAERSGQRWDP